MYLITYVYPTSCMYICAHRIAVPFSGSASCFPPPSTYYLLLYSLSVNFPTSYHFFLLPTYSSYLSDVSLRFDQDDYANTEDMEQITFTVQRTALGGALSTLVNPIEIRVIPVMLDNFDRMRYPPPPDFPTEPLAQSK